MKIDWLRKLSSRKLWMAIALFTSGVLTAIGKDKAVAENVAGLIMQGAAVIGYLLAEGLTDAAYADSQYEGKHQKDDESD